MQILSLDLAKPGLEIPRIGASVPLKSSILSVQWGSFGIESKRSKVQCSTSAIVCFHMTSSERV